MKAKLTLSLALTLLCLTATAAPKLRKNNIDKVVASMTTEEKVLLLLGTGMSFSPDDHRADYIGRPAIVSGQAAATHAIERLGIPSIVLCDGPAGLHIDATREGDDRTYYCTGFPVATCLASSWNTDLVQAVGQAMGNETLEYGADIILAPAMNIMRSLLCGRNFEYYSEDPLLSGRLGAAMVRGIQDCGVGTSVKHFIAGGKETNSTNNDARVSRRALREIYLRGFEVVVNESDPWTIMTSYNKVNGVYNSENRPLLEEVVRQEWGYAGAFVTDWWAGRDAVAQVNSGNDLIMPGRDDQYQDILAAVNDGRISMEQLDKNVKQVLTLIVKSPKFRGYQPSYCPDLEAHAQVTRQSATEGMVLLENREATLPIDKSVHTLGLFGNTSYEFIPGGTGSGDVNRAYTVDLVQGLTDAGYELLDDVTARYRTYIDGERAKEEKRHWFFGKKHLDELYLDPAVVRKAARDSDMGIFTLGRQSGEGGDRQVEGNFCLTTEEKALLRQICDAYHELGKRVVVVLNVGGAIETASWSGWPDAILLAWQPGQEGGHSVADLLTGATNPSGRLAVTFPVDYFDTPAAMNFPYVKMVDGEFFPGEDQSGGGRERRNLDYVDYEEDIYVGYRYYDTFNHRVAYPFGYGLSYTDFDVNEPSIRPTGDGFVVSVKVTNRGHVAGKEVVQVYVASPAQMSLHHPDKELRGFAKTRELEPGESETLTIGFSTKDLASYSEAESAWVTEAGEYQALVARSATDILHRLPFEVDERLARPCHDVLQPQHELHLIR